MGKEDLKVYDSSIISEEVPGNTSKSQESESGTKITTIRGHMISIFDDTVVKFYYDQQEITNLEILDQYRQSFLDYDIIIPEVTEKRPHHRQMIFKRLPFGNFPSVHEYFGEGEFDHLDPLNKLVEFRRVCTQINEPIPTYPDNNDLESLLIFVNEQKTDLNDKSVSDFTDELVRLQEYMGRLPRVIAHRDFTPGNVRSIPNFGCILLDFSTFGESTYGADEGRWYTHHVLNKSKQADILKHVERTNIFGYLGELSFLVVVGMRSAREIKMLQAGKYYDQHFDVEIPDVTQRDAYKKALSSGLLEQLHWVIQLLKDY